MRNERILEYTFNELAVHGFKHASVDSIASKMHISKKTIYELFENKEKLLLSALKYKIGKIIEGVSDFSKDDNVLCGMMRSAVSLFKFFSSVSPVLFEEMQLCHAAKEYSDSVKELLLANGKRHFSEGIEAGYLIKEADFEIVGRLFESQVMALKTSEGEKYTSEQICFYSLFIILRGVCTDKGRLLLDEIACRESDARSEGLFN